VPLAVARVRIEDGSYDEQHEEPRTGGESTERQMKSQLEIVVSSTFTRRQSLDSALLA
jgi:hypothetical protein